MKVIALNGSPLKARGNTAVLLNEFVAGLQENGAKVEVINLCDLKINPCLGKLVCWVKTPGKCCQKDDMVKLLAKLRKAELWVLASPIYWDGVTGPMKSFLDRLLPLIEPTIELRNDHCRHALRSGVDKGKMVFISTCGFWELGNFKPAVSHLKAISENLERDFTGALLRPHGALIKYLLKEKKKNPKNDGSKQIGSFQEVLDAVRSSANELINDGKISLQTEMKVSQELVPKDKYIKMINNNFQELIGKNK